MTDTTYPPATRIMLELQNKIAAVTSTIERWHPQLYTMLCESYPEHFENVQQSVTVVNGSVHAKIMDQDDPTVFLISNGEATVQSFNGLLSAMETAFKELGKMGLLGELDNMVFSVEDERQKLARVRETVSRLTPIHRRVQLHYADRITDCRTSIPLFTAPDVRLTEATEAKFYTPLTDARDMFFEAPSAAVLAEYLATSERLSQLLPPSIRGIAYVRIQRTPEQLAASAELEDELIKDELMLGLLEGAR